MEVKKWSQVLRWPNNPKLSISGSKKSHVNGGKKNTARCSEEVTNQSFPFQEARQQNLGCCTCHFRGSTHRASLSSYSATRDLPGSRKTLSKCCRVMCSLTVTGMTGIQDSVSRKSNQTHRSCSSCSSTCLMHGKYKWKIKSSAGSSQPCQLTVQV